ncbi:hypothetical protein ACONUD_09405 [Microbulbifer harenosus]|uniref:Uncharacterized protein n=1 Tax=Microbulbifer harenosus TaxID=2576840 RepID=A0ABY2UM51_9GAMM|nr:hypothetical protein [Microbulbifer harenosus]TLM76965.1 hypothetical protein FDY93_11415 [Microbulbifer harenosus]
MDESREEIGIYDTRNVVNRASVKIALKSQFERKAIQKKDEKQANNLFIAQKAKFGDAICQGFTQEIRNLLSYAPD